MKEKIMYALGYFDGVHLGHKALLDACRKLAEDSGCRWGVVTFGGHPDTLVQGKAPGLINTDRDRKKLLCQLHTDTILELPFDKKLMAMPWQDFLSMLVKDHHAAGFVCGTDFRFGKNGEGNARLLEEFCLQQKLVCCAVEQQCLDGIRISSTHIRNLLEQGNMEEANRFLGHPHFLSGTVVTGKQLGRTIGAPTANLLYPAELAALPYGVYACQVETEGQSYAAVTNIGTRPTVSGEGVTVESWLLDFSGDLYGVELKISFIKHLRPECKFPNLSELQKQIQKDKKIVENIVQNNKLHP